jgi:protein involved in polysaccharide export with SLBB domain
MVEEDPSLNGRYSVNSQACIDFSYIGLVFLQDMTTEQAEMTLKTVLEGRYLTRATVGVRIAKASYDIVGVRGFVESPGDIKVGPGTAISVNEALRRANGVRMGKDNLRIKIVRGGLTTPFGPAAEGEIYPLMGADGRLKVPELYLRNNDLAYVFAYESTAMGVGGKRVLMLGEVPRRGVIDFAENEPCTLMYLLFKVGGLPRFAKATKIRIVRRDRLGRETTIVANGEALLKEGNPDDDVQLENGDRIIVPARKVSFF